MAIIQKGISTIRFGTGTATSVTSSAISSTYIIESCSFTQKNGAPIEIEDGQGLAAALIFMPDGFDAELSLVDDSALTAPVIGSSGNLVIGGQTFTPCWVKSVEPSLTRKQEGKLKVGLIYRPGVTS